MIHFLCILTINKTHTIRNQSDQLERWAGIPQKLVTLVCVSDLVLTEVIMLCLGCAISDNR